MQGVMLVVKAVATHSFQPNVWDTLIHPVTGQSVPKYFHNVIYRIVLEDRYGRFVYRIFEYQTQTKEESFLISQIVRRKRTALLSIKHPIPSIQKLAQRKLSIFPDINVIVKHEYLNKIPKEHLLPPLPKAQTKEEEHNELPNNIE